MTLQVFFENVQGRVPIGDYSTIAIRIASLISQRKLLQPRSSVLEKLALESLIDCMTRNSGQRQFLLFFYFQL